MKTNYIKSFLALVIGSLILATSGCGGDGADGGIGGKFDGNAGLCAGLSDYCKKSK